MNPDDMESPAFSYYHLLIIWQYFNHLDSMNTAHVSVGKRESESSLASGVEFQRRVSRRVIRTLCS